MRIMRIIKEGAQSLLAHKSRTFFMMAGTLIGVAALTTIMIISVGTAQKLKEQIGKWPHDVIKVNAGGGKGYTMPQGGVVTLVPADAEAILNQIDNLNMITSVAEKRGWYIQGNGKETQTNIFSIQPNWHEVMNWYMQEGESVTDEDLATMNRVCVLGTIIREELYPDQNPIGETVMVTDGENISVRFQVKGLLGPRGTGASGRKSDDRILIPLDTALRRVFNQEHLSYIRMTVQNPETIEDNGMTRLENTADEVHQLMHERHHITPPEEDDFSIVHAAVVLAEIRPISKAATVLLFVLAGLSLVVGGIVLMNIMLISVNERTAEIGLRRALGATRSDIFIQFLNESLVVTLFGIVVGGVLSWITTVILAKNLEKLKEIPMIFSWELFILIVVFALLVGTFSGVLPARRAAGLRPVEALR